METAHIWGHVLLALMLIANTGPVWAQANEEMVGSVTDTPAECGTFVGRESRFTADTRVLRTVSNGVMVAEDMRCGQCRGKCAAGNLRCRSQCLGDAACLAQCDAQKSACEQMCKQLFSCE